jgi:hypothetical protein
MKEVYLKYRDAVYVALIASLLTFAVHNAYFSEQADIAEQGRLSFCRKLPGGAAQLDAKNRYMGCVLHPLQP